LPEDAITVPACAACHTSSDSIENEYLRSVLSLAKDSERHPDGAAALDATLRALADPKKAGLRDSLVRAMAEEGLRVDSARIKRSVERIVRGLHYHEFMRPVPAGGMIRVVELEEFRRLPAPARTFILDNVVRRLPKLTSLVRGVAAYSFGTPKQNPDCSVWVVTLYGWLEFLVLVMPNRGTVAA
jgi:hypothetical protein